MHAILVCFVLFTYQYQSGSGLFMHIHPIYFAVPENAIGKIPSGLFRWYHTIAPVPMKQLLKNMIKLYMIKEYMYNITKTMGYMLR